MKRLFPVLFALELCHCGGALTPRPIVVVDDDFTEMEKEQLRRGVSTWGSVVPGVQPKFESASHAQIIAHEFVRDGSNVVFLLASAHSEDPAECPGQHDLTDTKDAITVHPGADDPMICVNVAVVRAWWPQMPADRYERFVRYIGAHEFGHALGLVKHSNDLLLPEAGRDVMYFRFADIDQPSCRDAQRMAEQWGLVAACDQAGATNASDTSAGASE